MVRKVVVNPRQKGYFDLGDDTPREVRILRDILPKNDRILNFLYYDETPGRLELYYEYYPGGDLHTFIQRYSQIGRKVPEAFIWHVYLQCLQSTSVSAVSLPLFVSHGRQH